MGKKIKGRKRHIVVDTLGNLLSVEVHAANIHDTKGGILAAQKALAKYPSILRFCADADYRSTFEKDILERYGLEVDISEKIKPKVWTILPWRWIVERTFSCFTHSRRLSKDYEITILSVESVVKRSHIKTLLQRL